MSKSDTTATTTPITTTDAPIEISFEHISRHQESLKEQSKGKKSLFGEKTLTIQQLYADRLLAGKDEDREYLKVIDRAGVEGKSDGKFLVIEERKILDLITPLMKECFGDVGLGKKFGQELDEKYKAMVVEEAACGKNDEKRELVLNRGLFLYGQLDFLRKLADEKKLLRKAEERLKEVNAAENMDTAHLLDVGRLAKESHELSSARKESMELAANSARKPMLRRIGAALEGATTGLVRDVVSGGVRGVEDNLYGGKQNRQREIAEETDQVYLPIGHGDKLLLEEFISGCKHNISELEGAVKNSLETGKLPEKIDIDTRGQRPLGDRFFSNTGKSLVASGQSLLHHTGLWRDSSRTDDPRWREFAERRNVMLDNIRNHPDLASSIEFRKEFLKQSFDSGLITAAEFNSLSVAIDEQTKNADAKHKEYLKKLQDIVESADKDLLGKIDKDLVVRDDLYKYKILHFLILSSVVFPVPLVGVLFEALEPFLGGDLDLSEFLSSFFSVDGPFGDLAWLTDKMEFDKGMEWLTGDVLGGPFELMDSILDIGKEFAAPAAQGVGASPFQNLLLSVALEAYSGSIQKSADNSVKQANMLPNANKALQEKIEKEYEKRDKEIRVANREYLKSEFDLKEDVSKVSKIGDWIQEKYNQSPKSCKLFLENALKNKERAKAILENLENGKKSSDSNEALILDLLFNQNEDLFKQVLMLRSAEKTSDGITKVSKIFSYDFTLQQLENLKGQYQLVEKVNSDQAVKELTDLLDKNGKLKTEHTEKGGELRSGVVPNFIKITVDGKGVFYKIENPQNITKEKLDIVLNDLNVIEGHKGRLTKKQKKNIDETLKGVEYQDVEKELKIDFGIEQIERSGDEHEYLPAKINRLMQDSLVDELVGTLQGVVDYNLKAVFSEAIIDAMKDSDADKVKELLKEDNLTDTITDEMLLSDVIKKSGIDGLFEKFSAEKENKSDRFDLEEFWEKNCKENLGNSDSALKDKKSARKSENHNLIEQAKDRMLLIGVIKRVGSKDLFEKFSEESQKGDFNFDQFWEKNCATNPELKNTNSVLKLEKSLKKLQSLVIEDYLLKNEDKTKEDAEKHLVGLVFDESEAVELKDSVFLPEHIKKLEELAIKVSKGYDKESVIPNRGEYVEKGLFQMRGGENKHIKPRPDIKPKSVAKLQGELSSIQA